MTNWMRNLQSTLADCRRDNRKYGLFAEVCGLLGARLGVMTHDDIELVCKPEHRATLVKLGEELGIFERQP